VKLKRAAVLPPVFAKDVIANYTKAIPQATITALV